MANISEIKARKKSVSDIMKITNAMYLISSSKMKRAKQKLNDTEPYFITLQNTIAHILKHTPHTGNAFFHRRDSIPEDKRKKGFIIITGDKGLAGAYNHNVLRFAEEEMKRGGEVKLFIIGQVGRMYFARKGISYEHYFRYTAQNPTMFRAREVANIMIDKFLSEELDDVYVVYTHMVSSMVEEPKIVQILPFKREKFTSGEIKGGRKIHHTAAFVPSPGEVMTNLVPNYAKGLLYGAMVEAYAAENHARMMAMDSATKSARDMIHVLNLEYNRARQAAITQEITEVVSGAKNRGGMN
ncbi:MAG TPA: ATP synthase F1 subunit gamma [Candidatus Monoglobus merdigallinarum]|uniref:ATP synthase gamma chain n=1 Tax=Candidatus Monoglobus merdigallinarum TaxID=2838698 RepID=A0A9D1TLA3_9FIRM|nr:ATP synthase F1 subunit gamma [Candidatus Monoglobus merdigallinarum]